MRSLSGSVGTVIDRLGKAGFRTICPVFSAVPRGLFTKTRALAGFHRILLQNMVEWYLLLYPGLRIADVDTEDNQDQGAIAMNSDTRIKDTRGTLMMLGASICFSLGGILLKIIPWNPFAINGVRNLIAACVIGLYIFNVRNRQQTDHRRKCHRPAVQYADLADPSDVSVF